MTLIVPSRRYDGVAQLLHWLTALLVIAAWSLGEFDDVLPKGAGRVAGLFAHISVGLAILAIVSVRVPWQMAYRPLHETAKVGTWVMAWTGPVARIAHYTMYMLLAAVPITGIVLQFARGNAVPLFGFGAISSPWAMDRAFASNAKEIHEFAANALVILAFIHALAALLHHFVLRDRTLLRMLPRSPNDP
jgi:cytochrome b561